MSVKKVGVDPSLSSSRGQRGRSIKKDSAPSPAQIDIVKLEKRDRIHADLRKIKEKVTQAGLYKNKRKTEATEQKFSISVIGSYRIKDETATQEGELNPPIHYLNLACAFLEECLRINTTVQEALKLIIEKDTEFNRQIKDTSKLTPTEVFYLACNLGEYTTDIDNEEVNDSNGKSEITEAIALIISALNISKSDAKEKLAPFLIPYDKKDDDYEDCLELAFRGYKKNINDAFKMTRNIK